MGTDLACQPTSTPAPDQIDIPALRAKYAQERDMRIKPAGKAQYDYARPSGDVAADYVDDPHTPVAPRDPISEDIDVVVLEAGWGGILASYHLTKAGITDWQLYR